MASSASRLYQLTLTDVGDRYKLRIVINDMDGGKDELMPLDYWRVYPKLKEQLLVTERMFNSAKE